MQGIKLRDGDVGAVACSSDSYILFSLRGLSEKFRCFQNLNSARVGDSHPRIRSYAIENSKVYFRYVGEHDISKINIYRIGHSQIFPNSAELRFRKIG